jgi:hypothetical protein
MLLAAGYSPLIPEITCYFGRGYADGCEEESLIGARFQGGLLDMPKTRLLHYAVFLNFPILQSVYYKESA